MQSDLIGKNAVAAIRVSTTKQGTDGDSPEAQKEQIERFAENKGIVIKKFFVFMESASKEQQPMQDVDKQIKNLALERTKMESKKPIDIDKVIARVRKFSENIGAVIAQQSNDIKKAQLFGLLFNTLPTYNDLSFRNQKTPLFTGVNPIFSLLANDNFPVVSLTCATWNTLYPSLVQLDKKLEELGIVGNEVKNV